VPNRILKESICTSDSIASLSLEAEQLFYRMIVNCDDYGVLDARISILKSRCFPLISSDITDEQMKSRLKEIADQNIIIFYENSGRYYIKMVSWENHQQIRAKRPKYPLITDNNSNLISSDIICNQMISNVTVIQSNPIQSNPIRESESNLYVGEKESPTPPDTSKQKKQFILPEVEEIFAYCSERNNKVDPQRFFDFYQSKGWMVGKNKMKDWKAAVRTWESGKNQTLEKPNQDYSDPGLYKPNKEESIF
jgi:hypothetical protein